MIPASISSTPLPLHPTLLLLYLLITLIAPSPVDARECYWYTDSLGRRRRRCRGLIPGIVAAVVIGFFVILAFLSLAFVLRRRQRRAKLEAGPIFTAVGPENNTMMSQPPTYPPPSYPTNPPTNHPPPAAYYRLEKNETGGPQDPSIQTPPQANLASHHASH